MKRLHSYWQVAAVMLVAASAHAACVTSLNVWQNSSLGIQTGSFTAQFDATPSMVREDGVVGLSNGPASAFTSLAAAVRFNNTGTIDARNGGAFAATAPIPYSAGSAYHFRLAVNVTAHTYSAYVTPPGGAEKLIGSNYGFRAEQLAVASLSNLGALADSGSETVCNASAASAGSGSTGSTGTGSVTTTWQNNAFPVQTGKFEAKFDATPGASATDGVVGLSNGSASTFTSLAAAVRFNNTGTIDARNGAAYTAATTVGYASGTIYHFRIDVNIANHTYTAYVTPNGGTEQLLGSNYAFRTEQAAVTQLNNLGAMADAGSETVGAPSVAAQALPPSISIAAPVSGASVSGTLSVTASASSPIGVTSVQFKLDGSNLGSAATAAPYAVSWNTAQASNGSHTLTATATDSAGQSTTSSAVTVTVNNSSSGGTGSVTTTWQNNAFTAQTGTFEAKFDAIPGASAMDGVAGLSNGSASAFTSLAAAVRFNNTNTIDARNGGAYAAASSISYTPGKVYHFRLDVNVPSHVYNAYVTPDGGTEVLIGSGYAFRTEQATATQLGNQGAMADAGSETVGAPTILAWSPSGTGGGTPPPPSGYDATVLNDKPIAFWDMKNPTGSETDLTGNGHVGTYNGGAPALTTLPNGEAVVDFNTSTSQQQYLTVASPADHGFSIPTTRQLTWEAWIRPDVLQFAHNTGSGYIDWMGKCAVYGSSGEPCEWEARMYSTTTSESPNRPNRISGYVFNAGAGLGSAADWQPAYVGSNNASSIIQAKDWLHVVAEYQTVNNGSYSSCGSPVGTITIWVNGVMWSQSNHAPTGCMSQFNISPTAGSSPVNIGTMAKDSWFQGAIGKVAIYNTLLSPSQITAHYVAMTGTQPSGSCGNTCTAAFPLSK